MNDATYSFYPTAGIIRSTVRRQITAYYSPSFVFYEPTTVLNTINHGASMTFQDRFSPHITFNLEDFFYRRRMFLISPIYFQEAGSLVQRRRPGRS
ncbi:MAG: hypothetical protein WDM87_05195 [Terracidiphilus sp.]